MQSDHNMILEKSEAQDLIIDQAIENSQQYSLYHFNKTLTHRQTLQNTDSFMSDLIDFFESRDFTRDIVDLITQITADALGLNIYIYQQNILPNRKMVLMNHAQKSSRCVEDNSAKTSIFNLPTTTFIPKATIMNHFEDRRKRAK